MEFRILGPLEAFSDGEPVDLGPPKQRALLALLLLHVDRVVPTDRILDELWGPDSAGKEKALWVHISRLRSALEPHRAERTSSVLVTRDHGYTIRSDPETVDARRFELAVAEARSLLADDPERTASMLREALGLWRGRALQDFAYEEFARAEIARLEEMRLEAIETRVEADLRRGLTMELVGELELMVERQPLRERPVMQLMHALYRSGRQAEALRAAQRHRSRLAEDLGLEPSPELRRLEEQILLHDQRLSKPSRAVEEAPKTNPFRGLHAFQERDAELFFGRERLVAEVLDRVDREPLVAVVGPSGSGKSSVVRAGLVPALHKGALPGSERWLVASMVPGAHPFAELEAALLRSTLDAPSSLDAQLGDPRLGFHRAVLRLLPDEDTRLVLVIDQFEELFTLVDDDAERSRFVANLLAAVDDPRGRVRVVVTLRADQYHRPLAYPDLATRLGAGVVNVAPMAIDELEEAAAQPAARRGVTLEPALLAELLTEVVGEPGALPVFQYALTELFDRRDGDRLTFAAYRALGGASGVLSRRADDLYHRLDPEEQEVARQLLLRLVVVTEHEQWGRRRVPASELLAMDVDVVTMESVVAQLGRHRFLAFDRDHATGAPTVEVAHEALLAGWDRLRGWIEAGRVDIGRRAALDAAVAEWVQSGHDVDYLLSGRRLTEYERWRAETTLRLTSGEAAFLDASVAAGDAAREAEQARTRRESGRTRRTRRRRWALAVTAVVLAGTGVGLGMATGAGSAPTVAMLHVSGGDNPIAELMLDGFERAGHDFDFEPVVVEGPFADLDDQLASLATSGTDLVLFTDLVFLPGVLRASEAHPDVSYAFIDVDVAEEPSWLFAEHEGAYLAGAAAALTSETGRLGFVGGMQTMATERFRAGFEAGARAADPSVEIVASYLDFTTDGFLRADRAETVAVSMFQGGVDVILHAAGVAGDGVFTAAWQQSGELGRHLWAIGADADQYLDVPERVRPHVLTSTIKRFDVAVYDIIRDHLDGGLLAGVRELTLADGAVGFSTSGGNLSDTVLATLATMESEIVAGTRAVPRAPAGPLVAPPFGAATHTATVTFDGVSCRYDGPTQLASNDVVEVEVSNAAPTDAVFGVWGPDEILVVVPAPADGSNRGFLRLPEGTHRTACREERFGPAEAIAGPMIHVGPPAVASPGPTGADPASLELVADFFSAYEAFDAERAMSFLSDDAVDLVGSSELFRLDLAVLQAIGYQQVVGACRQVGDAGASVLLQCPFEMHALRSADIGRGPFAKNTWELAVRDGRIVSARSTWGYASNGFEGQMWDPFEAWVSVTYPEDAAAMYGDETHSNFALSEESAMLWEKRTKEWAAQESAVAAAGDG